MIHSPIHSPMRVIERPSPDELFRLAGVMFDPQGYRVPVAAELARFSPNVMAVWCKTQGLYTVATQELIDWLRREIGGRKAIEIGAGHGVVGLALGIPQTDADVLGKHEHVRDYYRKLGERVTPLPDRVERIDAIAAVEKYKPEVVVGCWITQLGMQSSPYGVDEERLLGMVGSYIMVGNRASHAAKKIMAKRHNEHLASWLVSRSMCPTDNYICVWKQ